MTIKENFAFLGGFMNKNKSAEILNRIFNITFLLSFSLLFFAIIFFGYGNNSGNDSGRVRFLVVAGFLILLTLFTGIYIFIQSYKDNPHTFFTDKKFKIITFSVLGAMLIIQLTAGYFLQMTPVTDLKTLNKYALDFAQNGNFNLIQTDFQNDYAYLIRYPNNMALVFFLSFLYRLAYLNYGYIPMYLPVVVNALAINASVLLGVFIARKVFGNRKAFMVLILSFLFAPFYTYVSYYYTDSISMPFCMGAVYLFVCAVKSDSKYKKYVLMAMCGVVTLLGYKIKGSVILLLAIAFVYLFLKFKFKKSICLILAFVAGFGVVNTVYTVALNNSKIVTKEQSEKYEYPYTHWIMMGLKGVGGYNKDDDMYTRSFSDKKEMEKANIEEIGKRINDYGIEGLTEHIAKKAVWTWADGTYYISHHIEKSVRENVLHSFVLDKGENHLIFYIYSCGFQLFLLFMLCMSAVKGCIKSAVNIQTFLKGIVFAAFIFFIIWETRSRYLYNFTPILLLLSVDGLDFVSKKLLLLKDFVKTKAKKA